jgi:cellobiose-specific phosphotransferase system component IIA
MLPDHNVAEMAEEVLARQAKAMVAHTRQPFESALEAVASTEAGQQLRDLANGEHRLEKAQDWQESLLAERAEGRCLMHLGGIASENTLSRFMAERHYSWVETYMEWLEGKEDRPEYHALLEEELASLRG